jgi:hypothetical protein
VARGSFAGNVGKGALGVGVGVGFALFYFLRLGGGFGLGGSGGSGGGGGRGEGAGQAPSPTFPPGPPAPPPPKDALPLLFWVFEPADLKEMSKLPDPTSRTRVDARFLLMDLGTAEFTYDQLRARVREFLQGNYKARPALSLDEVIARVKAGGRDDVRLMTSGGIRAGTYDDAKDALMAAGIKHWELWHEWPSDRKPGQPPKPALWNLYDADRAAGLFPDKNGHYYFRNMGSGFWNLRKDASPPTVSGDLRGYYGARAAGRGRRW